eukprot:TRINITY_DN739_c0_g1::TRINITY_DN739_c0_g1_i1::g.18372::m.18372 TRINITY_DN739_c0_g1::TRINITY_DN739_c0_g1_i1::g.18372  ORF type:complete len:524 (-),score=125.20,sp/Q10RZ1/BAMY2_ORYSJ/41.11/3e-125,Glyco_hydro_14/PF01373.12/3e-62,Glyco_hydro_14/PF01373.12/1.1e-43,Trefoil/PF00088.13/2.2e-12,Trefoil/PF00088.13/1.4e+03 TRINITY_DN739_c0_g1_i1:462-2033(-)
MLWQSIKRFLPLLLIILPYFVSAIPLQAVPQSTGQSSKVFVMMALDLVTNDGYLKSPDTFKSQLSQLKSANVDGIMLDVWWGIVERSGPKQYDWKAYQDVVRIAKEVGLKIQFVLSFHQCGGNVNDACSIPLPQWVRDVSKTEEIFYKDSKGHSTQEYLSLSVDDLPIFQGRTALQMYRDFMQSLATTFSSDLGTTIIEWQVGLGPAGELRYPAYQLDRWSFPGVGAFQAYDRHMLADLKAAAEAIGKPEWGRPPTNAGSYSDLPANTGFFNDNACTGEEYEYVELEEEATCSISGNRNDCGYNGITESQCISKSCCWSPSSTAGAPWCYYPGTTFCESWKSAYGQFFLDWYSKKLIAHGDKILAAASEIAKPKNVELAAKIAGIHWWYMTAAHGPELTAGYYNTQPHEGYMAFASMFAKYGIIFDFTCLEMKNSEQQNCGCGPENLVAQTKNMASQAGVLYAGENALPRYDRSAYQQIENTARTYGSTGRPIHGFTYLRVSGDLLGYGFNDFKTFVNNMHNL